MWRSPTDHFPSSDLSHSVPRMSCDVAAMGPGVCSSWTSFPIFLAHKHRCKRPDGGSCAIWSTVWGESARICCSALCPYLGIRVQRDWASGKPLMCWGLGSIELWPLCWGTKQLPGYSLCCAEEQSCPRQPRGIRYLTRETTAAGSLCLVRGPCGYDLLLPPDAEPLGTDYTTVCSPITASGSYWLSSGVPTVLLGPNASWLKSQD